jgi:hypothetical protein
LFAAQRLPAHPGANKPPTWSWSRRKRSEIAKKMSFFSARPRSERWSSKRLCCSSDACCSEHLERRRCSKRTERLQSCPDDAMKSGTWRLTTVRKVETC